MKDGSKAEPSLEYVGEHLAAHLRLVKNTEDLRSLMTHLRRNVEQKDEEIERICNGSYEDFISSFQEFVQHREEAKKIREELETIIELARCGTITTVKVCC
jgi:predicted phage-related endonuclease